MASAIHKTFLGRSINCVICKKFSYCQHRDDELRGDICWGCLPFVSLAECFLRSSGFTHATEWDEK